MTWDTAEPMVMALISAGFMVTALAVGLRLLRDVVGKSARSARPDPWLLDDNDGEGWRYGETVCATRGQWLDAKYGVPFDV